MELKEVDQKEVKDVMFERIGVDVPMLSKSEGFSSDQLPARGLAVSNRFGYTFFVHSRGFSVAKTADLLELARKLNDEVDGVKTAQEIGTATVTLSNIRILALSSDELTVGVCAGGNVMFHELATLIHKSDTRPFEVRTVDPHEDNYAKEFTWSPSNSASYLILTSQGKLLLGCIGSTPECKVEEGVVAASWSADGQHIAYVADNRQLSITTSNFEKTFQVELPVQLNDEDNDSDLHVDGIRWVRPDSIIVGYLRVNSEGEEDEYPLFVLNSRNGNLAQEDSKLVGLVFYQLFPSIDSFVVPSGSGPYMLTDYVKPWEMVVAASRKSIDDHIVLMGWLPEDGREVVYSLELGDDLWIPRIELQESGEDNALLGLAIDCTSVQIELRDPRDESGDSVVPPCPVLICLTLEGKLSFFTFARLDKKFQVPELVTRPSNVPDVKQPVPKASLQLTRVQDTSTALIPFSPTVVKVDKTKDIPPLSDIAAQARIVSEGDSKAEPLKQGGTVNRPKATIKDDRDSLFERLTSSAPSFPEGVTGDRAGNSRAGLTTTSQGVNSTSIPKSASTMRDLNGSENVASTYQGLFRPFDDASKSGLVKPAPPQVQWGSQLPAALPATSSVPLKTIQVRPVPSPSAAPTSWGVQIGAGGVQIGSAPLPTVTLSSSAKGQLAASSIPKLISNQRGTDRFTPGSQTRTFQDQQPSVRGPGVTTMEAAFTAELEKVRKMSEEVNDLMSYIEGRWRKDASGNPAAFTKQALEELEQGIHQLSEECKGFRRKLNQEKQDIEDLRDEEMRVDTWRIYTQSLMEQKNDSRHQELWAHQKLHPELEMKRKRVLNADQDLKVQIAELERHLHNLELKQWQQDSAQRRSNKQMRSPGQFLSVQNLYNTVNTQMAVAEELSNSLAQQMETLDIRWSSPAHDSKTTAAVILKSVGVTTDDPHNVQSPLPRQRLSYSPVAKGVSINRLSTPSVKIAESSVQETTRRRRDSMDAAWVNRGAPTTTIKRTIRERPMQSFSPRNPSMPTYRQGRLASADTSANENWSQSRNMRPAQNTRMQPSKNVSTLSFPTPTFERSPPASGRTGMTSSAQWPSLRPEPQQIRQGSASPFGDPTGSSGPTTSNNSKESLFKFTINAPIATSKASSNMQPSIFQSIPSGKQFTPGSFDGASTGLVANSLTAPATKPTPFGTLNGIGVFNNSWAPSTKSTTANENPTFRRQADEANTTKLQQTDQKSTTATENPSLRRQVDEANTTKSQQTDQKLTTANANPTLRRQAGEANTTKLQQSDQKLTTANEIPTLRRRQADEANTTKVQQTDQKSTTVHENPTLRRQEDETNTTKLQQTDQKSTSVNESPTLRRQADETNTTKVQQADQQVLPSSFSGGTSVRPFDLNSLASGSVPLTATSASPFSSPIKVSPFPVESPVSKPVIVSTQALAPISESSSPAAEAATDSTVIQGELGPPVKTPAAAPTAPPIFLPLPTSGAKLEGQTPTVNGHMSSTNMGAHSVPNIGTPPRTTTTPSIFSSPSPSTSTGPFSGSSSTSGETQAFSTPTRPALSPSGGSPFTSSSVSALSPSGGSPFTSSSVSALSPSGGSPFTSSSVSALSPSGGSPFASSSVSAFSSSSLQSVTSSPFGQSTLWQPAQQPTQPPFVFPGSSTSSMISTPTISSSPLESNEEDMEEEASTGVSSFGGFGGLGLGNSGAAAQTQKTNPFGGSPFGNNSQPFQLTPPTGGQLFRPAAFNLPAAQASSPQAGGSAFGSGFGSPGFSQNNLFSETGKGFGSPPQVTAGGFGQPAQLGPGQQALGSALGAFGQTRQVGFGTTFGGGGSMGSTPSGGFANASPGGGFASAATGGGFANASTGGGFANASTGGGFANAATGGGFASAPTGGGFAGAGMGGGFAGAAGGGGFAGVASGSAFTAGGTGGGFGGLPGGGFQAFAGNQGPSPAFGGGVSPVQTSLFTQMRK